MSSPDLTAIVLAGGRASRFGRDKLAIEIDGRSVLDRAIDAVAAIAADVVVVGDATSEATIRRVRDPEPFGGPLQALAAGLATASTELAIVVGGDTPSLVPSVLGLLVEALRADPAADAVVVGDPDDPSRRQPLPLALRVASARIAAAAAVAEGDRSLVRFLGRLRVGEVPAEAWLALDPDGRTLIDIDAPADLDRLRGGSREPRNC